LREAPNEPVIGCGPTPRQLVMREVNLKIVEIASRYDTRDGLFSFVCECSEPHCKRTITLHLHRFDHSMPAGSVLAHVPDGEQEPST
jgi:hypothetical protein